MQILSADQIRAWDQFTIQHEPISSIDLMERAAQKCVEWVQTKDWKNRRFRVFCGKGNNGGDGLAIGRLLLKSGYNVFVYVLETGRKGSPDFETNLHRLNKTVSAIVYVLQVATDFPILGSEDILVDALFGSGLNKPLDGLPSQLVGHINDSNSTVISVDLPSGLFIEKSSSGNAVLQADYTLTFQCHKLGLLVQENAAFVGEVQVLDIGLHPDFLSQTSTAPQLLEEGTIRKIFRPRKRFSHKGTFGHALLIGGSHGKLGAVVLATKSCMAAGAGLTTTFIPRCGYAVLQTTAPEAMTIMDNEQEYLTFLPEDIDRFAAIGIGPGMGTALETQKLFSFIVRRYQKPLVIDADGLNCLAQAKELWQQLPFHSVLTPHPKEFDRLFGEQKNDFERIEKAKEMAGKLGVIIVLKSHHTLIATPGGECFFNATGNAGMAKGGSGDVLTGILTSLLGQGYSPKEAAQLGVYLHGWAGDVAAKAHSMEAMLPSHLISCLGNVFLELNQMP